MHRPLRQASLADAFAAPQLGSNPYLEQLTDLLDWRPFETILQSIHASREGRAAYPPLSMFKVLLLQQWYELSDARAAEALTDRLSFRRFVGLPLDSNSPDQGTICRFRQQIIEKDLSDLLFAELDRQLSAQGVVLRKGTLIDATVIQSGARPPKAATEDQPTTSRDQEAAWHRRETGPATFGYKLHIGVDEGSGLVRKLVTTPANRHESQVFHECLSGDEQEVLADKAYDSDDNRWVLLGMNIRDGIMRRARRNRSLTEEEALRNRELSPRRSGIERIFGTLKRSYGCARLRVIRQAKVHLKLMLSCFAYNLRRRWNLAFA